MKRLLIVFEIALTVVVNCPRTQAMQWFKRFNNLDQGKVESKQRIFIGPDLIQSFFDFLSDNSQPNPHWWVLAKLGCVLPILWTAVSISPGSVPTRILEIRATSRLASR